MELRKVENDFRQHSGSETFYKNVALKNLIYTEGVYDLVTSLELYHILLIIDIMIKDLLDQELTRVTFEYTEKNQVDALPDIILSASLYSFETMLKRHLCIVDLPKGYDELNIWLGPSHDPNYSYVAYLPSEH